MYISDHEGVETIIFFGILNVSRGDSHSGTTPSDDARISNIASQIAKMKIMCMEV